MGPFSDHIPSICLLIVVGKSSTSQGYHQFSDKPISYNLLFISHYISTGFFVPSILKGYLLRICWKKNTVHHQFRYKDHRTRLFIPFHPFICMPFMYMHMYIMYIYISIRSPQFPSIFPPNCWSHKYILPFLMLPQLIPLSIEELPQPIGPTTITTTPCPLPPLSHRSLRCMFGTTGSRLQELGLERCPKRWKIQTGESW